MSTLNRPTENILPGINKRYTTNPKYPGMERAKMLPWLPNRLRHYVVSMVGEFVGTFLFLFFAYAGTQVANTNASALPQPNLSALLYSSLAFGFSLAVNVWVFLRISGGQFNPAVTVALALAGAVKWLISSPRFLVVSLLLRSYPACSLAHYLFGRL